MQKSFNEPSKTGPFVEPNRSSKEKQVPSVREQLAEYDALKPFADGIQFSVAKYLGTR